MFLTTLPLAEGARGGMTGVGRGGEGAKKIGGGEGMVILSTRTKLND